MLKCLKMQEPQRKSSRKHLKHPFDRMQHSVLMLLRLEVLVSVVQAREAAHALFWPRSIFEGRVLHHHLVGRGATATQSTGVQAINCV